MSENNQAKRSRDQDGNDSSANKKRNNDKYAGKSVAELEKLLAQKDEEIKKKDEEIEKKDEEIEKKDEQLKDWKRRHKRHSWESLMAVKKGDFQLSRSGAPFSHLHGDHDEAKAEPVKVFTLQNPRQNVLAEGVSDLLRQFVNQLDKGSELVFQKVEYGSEADICSLVKRAVDDAINILLAEGHFKGMKLTTMLERSLLGCRPDIMVVRSKDGVGWLAIEVKQPIEENKSLATYGKVLGHAFDHAQAMDAFGQGTALVLITTFEESLLCSPKNSDFDLKENKKCSEGEQNQTQQNQSQSPPIFKSPSPSRCQHSPIHPKVSVDDSSARPLDNSPSNLSASFSSTTDNKWLFTRGVEDRTLYHCKPVHSHELVKLAYTALKLAANNYEESTRTIYNLIPKTTYFFPRVLQVTEEDKESKTGTGKYCWGSLHFKVGCKIKSQEHQTRHVRKAAQKLIDKNDSKSYYIVGCLGRGSTSNVFRALDSLGTQVALKVYVKNIRDDDKCFMTQDEFLEQAKSKTNKEAEYLKMFYPSLEEKVDAIKVFGKWCVKMPLFAPIEKEKRKETLNDIETILINFTKKGKKYEEDDIRWRHVGKYKDQCILYDLADLEDLEEVEPGSEDIVEGLVKKFKDRLGESEAEKYPLNAIEK